MVIDVAMTETAQQAHYVLPAASQFEKWEATFFNLDFPVNGFHLRKPLFAPASGTLPEPEIYHRLAVATGAKHCNPVRHPFINTCRCGYWRLTMSPPTSEKQRVVTAWRIAR